MNSRLRLCVYKTTAYELLVDLQAKSTNLSTIVLFFFLEAILPVELAHYKHFLSENII